MSSDLLGMSDEIESVLFIAREVLGEFITDRTRVLSLPCFRHHKNDSFDLLIYV